MESSRTPFDYVESERELVSGYNTEYRSVTFVLFFLSEYRSLLFFSVLTSFVFFSGRIFTSVLFWSLFVFIRRSFPRVRYDRIIGLF